MKSFNPLLLASAVLAAAAAACAAWFGVSWYSAGHSSDSSLARTRDLVLQSGEQAVINLNSLDYRHASAGLQIWLSSSTGSLHDQLTKNLQQEVALVEHEGNVTTARVLDAAVTSLDPAAGTASAMFAVDISVVPSSGTPFRELQAEQGQLTLTGSGWKLSGLSYSSASASAATGGH